MTSLERVMTTAVAFNPIDNDPLSTQREDILDAVRSGDVQAVSELLARQTTPADKPN